LAAFVLRIRVRARSAVCALNELICVALAAVGMRVREFPGVASSLLTDGRMVQPIRLVLGFSALLSIVTGSGRAAADPLPASCRTGLVLGVSEQDAADVVGAVCNAATRRGTTGMVRVSVLAAGDKIRVGVARLADTKEPEQTAHAEAANIPEAIRIGPTVLGALDAPAQPAAPPPPRASASASASAPAPGPPPVHIEPPSDPPTKEQPSALETKAGPPAALLGVHGSSGVAGGGAGFGGGASIGVDHRSAQGFIDYSNSSASPSGRFSHHLATIGARLKLSQSSFQPVIGGGWSYVDYEHTAGERRTKGEGIGVFGELGAIYAMGNHQLMGLVRCNIGLYQETRTEPASYTRYDGERINTYETRSGGGSLSSSFAFLAGYAYAFR
jgi:hypothetical protein